MPQIPSDDAVSTMEYLYKAVTSRRVRPATAGIQNRYKQELIDNLRGFRNSNYDQMSIADNVLNNPDFLTWNNFAKVEQPERNAFQIFAYPKDDNFVQSVKIGKNGQRLGNVGFVCFDFVGCNGENMLNSYSIKSQKGSYLSGLKVKLEGGPDNEREYEVRKVTDLSFIDFLTELDENHDADYAFDNLMATNDESINHCDLGTVSINGANVNSLVIDNHLKAYALC